MQWEQLLGHEEQRVWLKRALEQNRLATSFLFIGPEGIGKRTFAKVFAKSLLCRKSRPEDLAPCGRCEDCAQVDASTHPDLIQLGRPPEKSVIPIELLIGEREKRMREGLCHDIAMSPYGNRRKIAILDDADALNAEGANALLKTLEEPPADSILILIGTSIQRQLPTIRSRCQAIGFQKLSDQQVAQLLLRNAYVANEQEATELAILCNGTLAEAKELADEDLRAFRVQLLEQLSAPRIALTQLTKGCIAVVEAAGKDAKAKRERLKLLFRFAAAFYRAMALQQAADSAGSADLISEDPVVRSSVARARSNWKSGIEGARQCWQRCLKAMEEVDRNANQAALLEEWSTNLATQSTC